MSNYDKEHLPKAYRPVSMWGYFGYQLLFALPLIGFVFLVIFALGGTSNINLRNFARSYFCAFILLAIIFLLLFASGIWASLLSEIPTLLDVA
ncbi:MAG: hypothetical protein IJ154_07730 [Bacteroidales bacterium]|nr:hypothetical protein [Bacteroidales bacterium]